jgi:MFS family permease
MEPIVQQGEIRRTTKISTLEGAFAQVHFGLTSAGSIFLTKFAVLLQATPMHFGILSAISQLSQVFQLLGVALTRRMTSRKGTVLRLLSVGRILPLAYILLPFFLPTEVALAVFLAIFFLNTSLQAVSGNLWVAWISDMIPLAIRGRFFSRRSQVLLVCGLLAGYLFSAFVDLFDAQPGTAVGAIRALLPPAGLFAPEKLPYAFAVVFGVGVAVGLVSVVILARQPEHPKALEPEPFWQLVAEPLRDGNFRRLLLYGLWWMLAIGIASPFWGPFMIKKLGMSLVNIQVYGTISTITSLLALRPWGALIDHFGNKTAMRLALVLGGLNPILWVFLTPQHYEIIFIEAATSGIMWSGAGIVATNFVLAIAPDGRRQVYSAVFGAFSGLAMMATMLLSGATLPDHPVSLGNWRLEPEQLLFGLGGLARWSTQIPLSWIHEPQARPMREVLAFLGQETRRRVRLLRARVRRR